MLLTILYSQETTTTQLRSDSCFADRLVILNDDIILSEDQKRDCAEILETFWTVGHFVSLRPFPAAGHVDTAYSFILYFSFTNFYFMNDLSNLSYKK